MCFYNRDYNTNPTQERGDSIHMPIVGPIWRYLYVPVRRRRWNGDKGKGAGGRWAQIDTSAVKRSGRQNPVGGVERSGAETQIKL